MIGWFNDVLICRREFYKWFENEFICNIFPCFAKISLIHYHQRNSKELYGEADFTNGAMAKDIKHLILKKYIVLLGGSFLVAVPLSYFAISKYLEDFAYKASISWWLFAIAGIVVVGISLITLTWQVRKAMGLNPADSLKSE